MNSGRWLAFNKGEYIHKSHTINATGQCPLGPYTLKMVASDRRDGNKTLTELRSIEKRPAPPGSITKDLTLALSGQHLRAQDTNVSVSHSHRPSHRRVCSGLDSP